MKSSTNFNFPAAVRQHKRIGHQSPDRVLLSRRETPQSIADSVLRQDRERLAAFECVVCGRQLTSEEYAACNDCRRPYMVISTARPAPRRSKKKWAVALVIALWVALVIVEIVRMAAR